jgi:hypothetical protein
MSRVPTTTSPRKGHFLTLRVTEEFRDALSVVAEQSLRSVSAQAMYYIQLGMHAEAREKALSELQNLTGA